MLTLPQHYQQQSTSCLFYFCLFLPDLLAIVTLVAIFGNAHRPHEHQHCQQQCLSVYAFSLFFASDFVTIFALITIFGNAHRPYKLYSNIVNHSLNHVYSFFPFSTLIFWLYLHYSPYLKMCTNHINSTPILSPMVCVMPVLFFVFFSLILWLYLQQLPY